MATVEFGLKRLIIWPNFCSLCVKTWASLEDVFCYLVCLFAGVGWEWHRFELAGQPRDKKLNKINIFFVKACIMQLTIMPSNKTTDVYILRNLFSHTGAMLKYKKAAYKYFKKYL